MFLKKEKNYFFILLIVIHEFRSPKGLFQPQSGEEIGQIMAINVLQSS